MQKLSDMTPYLGDVMPYLYDGSANEGLRVCSVYAMHLFPEGSGEMEIEGVRHPLDKRALVFLRPGQPHAFHISPERPLASYNLYFDLWDARTPQSLDRVFIYAPEPFHLPAIAAERPCAELDAMPGVSSLQACPELYEELLRIIKVYEESRYYRSEILNSMMYAWMLNWYNALHTRRPSDYRIVKLLEHLERHPEKRESVGAWWEMCGLNRTYFHELFLRETGFTPKAYQHRLRMRRAAILLRESDLSITAVADKLGYPSIHPFTRHFGAYYGVSPMQYRRRPATPPLSPWPDDATPGS
ncbi:helix-turn-helix transcriptional regulator [Cohnella sp. JJ-181]|uniref:helix-turn-helix transcriptional regulator n=1 Tax=Cohnella rhizoplanae TaxID=2974897 RepID=UPI0022FF9301|nr:AraC family transcriptional regulator [Cohnella sp. JJ-181]CAI6022820.1 HTH-type transcriptional activator RhaS [Cohnella sp. JJ-181]